MLVKQFIFKATIQSASNIFNYYT